MVVATMFKQCYSQCFPFFYSKSEMVEKGSFGRASLMISVKQIVNDLLSLHDQFIGVRQSHKTRR